MKTLLGHLAQFASFTTQGEVLCTQGLAYLLRHADARQALAAEIAARSGVALSNDLTWVAEAHQDNDRGRPDLEARRGGDRQAPVVKVEAKLGAPFGNGQLQSYANDLATKSGSVLVVLVPRYRGAEAIAALCGALQVSGPGPWRPSDSPTVTAMVISWEEVLAALLQAQSAPLHGEVEQFQDMYQVLSGTHIEPLATLDDLVAWRERAGIFENLVDRVTRRLSAGTGLMPIGTEPLAQQAEDLEPRGYRRRYICRPMGAYQPCFSVGVRDPFAGQVTPIWLRFNRGTPGFAILRARLQASPIWDRVIVSGGDLWVPLEVPTGVDGNQMVADLVDQAEEIAATALDLTT